MQIKQEEDKWEMEIRGSWRLRKTETIERKEEAGEVGRKEKKMADKKKWREKVNIEKKTELSKKNEGKI